MKMGKNQKGGIFLQIDSPLGEQYPGTSPPPPPEKVKYPELRLNVCAICWNHQEVSLNLLQIDPAASHISGALLGK